jgi:hypothetical protein
MTPGSFCLATRASSDIFGSRPESDCSQPLAGAHLSLVMLPVLTVSSSHLRLAVRLDAAWIQRYQCCEVGGVGSGQRWGGPTR